MRSTSSRIPNHPSSRSPTSPTVTATGSRRQESISTSTTPQSMPTSAMCGSITGATPRARERVPVVANITTGNKKEVAYASDLAGNVNTSAPVHIYNNNLVYFNDSVARILCRPGPDKDGAVRRLLDRQAFTLTGPNAWMTAPTLGELNKTITGGSNVTLDCRKTTRSPRAPCRHLSASTQRHPAPLTLPSKCRTSPTQP
jgi:hypothetical protein